MALNIPLPDLPGTGFLKGVDTGSSMFSKLMNPVVQRENMARQWKQHLDSLALQKAAAGRASQAASDAHKLAIMKLDPDYEINQLKRMLAAFSGGKAKQETQEQSYMPSIQKYFGREGEQVPPETEGMESEIARAPQFPSISYAPESFIPEIYDPIAGTMQKKEQPLNSFIQSAMPGLGGVQAESIPAINEQAVSPYEAAKSSDNGLNMDAIKKSPILRGWFKKHFGIDPGAPTAQTPEEKLLEKLQLHQENRLFDIEHPTNKEAALSGPARDAASLAKLKKDAGENSEVYQNAKAQYDAQIDAKKDLRDIRARTKAGLKPGEKEFFDPQTGAPLGKEIPLTAKEREAEEGNILFNEFFPYVYKGGSPFSGEGSIGRLEQAAAHYKTDPKAAQLFDDLLLSDKMLAATTVNEASTLKAGRTNRTYGMLKESLESQDIPKLIKKLIKEYKIPASAQLKASMRYQEILSNGRKKARKGTPATQKLYYDPELQAKNEAEKEEGNIAPTQTNGQYNDTDMVKVQGPNGIEIMTYAEAKKLGAQ